MGKLDCKKPKPCEPVEPVKEIYPPATEPFDLCVGDYSLSWDGARATTNRTRATPDGTYTSVTLVNGCIVGYGYADEPTYTPPYCNAGPSSCQGGGADGSTGTMGVKVSTAPGNQLTYSEMGLYSRVYITGGNGVTVTGSGTATDKYVVNVGSGTGASGGASLSNVVGKNGVEISKSENGVATFSLTPILNETKTIDINSEITVDKYGRVTEVKDRDVAIITAGVGIEAKDIGDTIEVGHPKQVIPEQAVLGGYTIAFNDSGHVTNITQTIKLQEGTYQLGTYDVTVNKQGSITGIKQQVEELPLRDMAKILVSSGNLVKEVYGDSLTINNSGTTVTISMPSYVVDKKQINVNNALSSVANFDTGVLTITVNQNQPATVAFRG